MINIWATTFLSQTLKKKPCKRPLGRTRHSWNGDVNSPTHWQTLILSVSTQYVLMVAGHTSDTVVSCKPNMLDSYCDAFSSVSVNILPPSSATIC